jgi:hypothetical protein
VVTINSVVEYDRESQDKFSKLQKHLTSTVPVVSLLSVSCSPLLPDSLKWELGPVHTSPSSWAGAVLGFSMEALAGQGFSSRCQCFVTVVQLPLWCSLSKAGSLPGREWPPAHWLGTSPDPQHPAQVSTFHGGWASAWAGGHPARLRDLPWPSICQFYIIQCSFFFKSFSVVAHLFINNSYLQNFLSISHIFLSPDWTLTVLTHVPQARWFLLIYPFKQVSPGHFWAIFSVNERILFSKH